MKKNDPLLNFNSVPTVSLKAHSTIEGAGLVRAILTVNHVPGSQENKGSVAAGIKALFSNKLEAVTGSIKSLDKGQFVETISAIISPVRQVVSVSNAGTVPGFKSVSSNMFIDEEDSLWSLTNTSCGKLLVKSSDMDGDAAIEALMSTCYSMSSFSSASQRQYLQTALSSADNVVASVEGGRYVSFVDASNSISSGWVVATDPTSKPGVTFAAILCNSNDDMVVVDSRAVVGVHDHTSFPLVEASEQDLITRNVARVRGAVDIEVLLGYYSRIYGKHPKFYAELSERIRNHQYSA